MSYGRWRKSGRKNASWLASPKKDCRSVMLLGDGNEEIAIIFCGSGLMPLSEMRKPAKEISVPIVIFFTRNGDSDISTFLQYAGDASL